MASSQKAVCSVYETMSFHVLQSPFKETYSIYVDLWDGYNKAGKGIH